MATIKSIPKRDILNIIGACIGWFAVVGQLVLIINNRKTDIFETIIRFFSFFTILTNILVALYFTGQISTSRTLKFIKTNSALTAITAFILIVGLVYQFVLRSVWQPTGFQKIIDELLHTLMPLYMLLYWFLYVKFKDLKLKLILPWLLYPLLYFIFILTRGHFSDYYPYPFIDVSSIGYAKVFTNFILLSAFALILIGILSLLARFFKRQ